MTGGLSPERPDEQRSEPGPASLGVDREPAEVERPVVRDPELDHRDRQAADPDEQDPESVSHLGQQRLRRLQQRAGRLTVGVLGERRVHHQARLCRRAGIAVVEDLDDPVRGDLVHPGTVAVRERGARTL